MKYIGIIAAMNEEVEAIKKLMIDISIEQIYELQFITGKINEKDIVLVKCGVGKVNAARATQILIDNFDLEYVINVGTAGSLNEEIEIGDIVIAEKLVQHDFDVTAAGREKGYITDTGKYFYSDKSLIEKAIQEIDEDFSQFIGIIATGDIFVQDIRVKDGIVEECNALSCVKKSCKKCGYYNPHITPTILSLSEIVLKMDEFGKTIFFIEEEAKTKLKEFKN